MRVDAKVVLLTLIAATGFTVFGYSLDCVIDTASASPFLEYLFTPAITLLAAFGGSLYAFKLQDEKNKRDLAERDVKAANSAIFELTRWHKKLHAINSQFITEHSNNPWRHFFILPVAGLSLGHPKFDYDSLAFLFKSKKPNLLGTLSLADLEISSTLDVIHQRSKMHVDVLQPAVEEVEKRFGTKVPPDEVEKQLGSRHSQSLKMLTDYMVSGVDNSLSAIRDHIDFINAETKGGAGSDQEIRS